MNKTKTQAKPKTQAKLSKKLQVFKKDLNTELNPLFETFLDLQVNLNIFECEYIDLADDLEDEGEVDQAFELLKNCGIDSIEATSIRLRFIDRKWEFLKNQLTQEITLDQLVDNKKPPQLSFLAIEAEQIEYPADNSSANFRKFKKALNLDLIHFFERYLEFQSQADGFYSKFGKLAKGFKSETESEQAWEFLQTSGIDEIRDNIFKQRFIEVVFHQLKKIGKSN